VKRWHPDYTPSYKYIFFRPFPYAFRSTTPPFLASTGIWTNKSNHKTVLNMAQTTARNTEQDFDLYVCKYSLCSLMTRYTIAVAGELKPGGFPVVVNEHEIDIVFDMNNLDEDFLVGVNPKGQVRHPLYLVLTQSSSRLLILFDRSLSGSTRRLSLSPLLKASTLPNFL
jgi:hypothetical protein